MARRSWSAACFAACASCFAFCTTLSRFPSCARSASCTSGASFENNSRSAAFQCCGGARGGSVSAGACSSFSASPGAVRSAPSGAAFCCSASGFGCSSATSAEASGAGFACWSSSAAAPSTLRKSAILHLRLLAERIRRFFDQLGVLCAPHDRNHGCAHLVEHFDSQIELLALFGFFRVGLQKSRHETRAKPVERLVGFCQLLERTLALAPRFFDVHAGTWPGRTLSVFSPVSVLSKKTAPSALNFKAAPNRIISHSESSSSILKVTNPSLSLCKSKLGLSRYATLTETKASAARNALSNVVFASS